MHQNPARLPFAWKLNECDWDSLAWEEEEAQGPEHMVLKVEPGGHFFRKDNLVFLQQGFIF